MSPLGKNEKDFSYVGVEMYGPEAVVIPGDPKIRFFAEGKLGGLKGGLLDLHTKRRVMNQEDIKILAEETTDQLLEKKRTGFIQMTRIARLRRAMMF